ncbi:hypothetical protein [Treponema sp. C6A8]|uniref:hypothetical protein n=1 Tax=Treponema sp. C6A8 TaxID=1410609 RepID=UPI0004880D4E|nr:hypothetical protein [Treponema sp. C6A8]
MKKIFSIIFTFFTLLSLFAYDGAVSGCKKILVYKTTWFDLIYAQENEETARILIANADRIYEEAAAQYGIKPQYRMPLVITQKVEQFNANWSSYPYNHIVIYDTFPTDNLQVLEDTILGTFWHEITHSVTYNMKNPFWKGLGLVFGDEFYPGSITVTRGMAEGAAVASESITGEGRLNSEFAKHQIKQAKIEGLFPYYSDVQGASDKYPAGSFYEFNGAFYQWVQDKYGIQKYADFWYRLCNLKSISVSGAFKKTFGQSLRSAWKEFENDFAVSVDSADKNPVKSGLAKDFFKPDLSDYSVANSSGAIYENLKKCDEGLIYINSKNSSLYFVDKAQLSGEKEISPEKLFTLQQMEKADISRDGRFIALQIMSQRAAATKSKLQIYDRKNGTFKALPKLTNVHDALILLHDGEYYLVCQIYKSPTVKIATFKLQLNDKGNLAGFTETAAFELPEGNLFQSMCSLQGEKTTLWTGESTGPAFAAIKKSGLDYSICGYDIRGQLLFTTIPGRNTVARYISYDEVSNRFLFTYTEPGSMPRLASYDLQTKTFSFEKSDFSGGIFNPVFMEGKIFYIGNFFRQNRIFIKNDEGALSDGLSGNKAVKIRRPEFTLGQAKAPVQGELNSKPYNRMNFLRGSLYPLSSLTSNSYNYGQKTSYLMPLSASYLNLSPWTSGIFIIAMGYGPITNSAGIQLEYQSGTFTKLFKYSISGFSEFDKAGWKQARASGKITSTIPFGRISKVILSDTMLLHYGRSNLTQAQAKRKYEKLGIGWAYSDSSKNYFYGLESISAGYSSIHKCGDGNYSDGGFSLAAIFTSRYNANNRYELDKYEFYNDLGFAASVALPRLLPLRDTLNLTFNLPSTLSLHLFAETKTADFSILSSLKPEGFPEFNAVTLDFESILFGIGIQKGAGILFFNDARLIFHYKLGFSYSELHDDDKWRILDLKDYLKKLGDQVPLEHLFGLKVAAGITPNYGITANYRFKTESFFEAGVAVRNAKSYGYGALGFSMNF